MTKEELAMERNEVREILECFSEELSQANLDKLSRVFCLINGDEKQIAELERKLKVETELSNRLGLAYREYEQLTKEQDEHLAKLEKENARLKDGIALKDEEVGCIETDFNTFKSKAKEIIKNLMKFAEIDCREYEEAYKEAEQFVKE